MTTPDLLSALFGVPSIATAPPPPVTPAPLSPDDQMRLFGITTQQKIQAYRGRLSDALFYHVKPVAYSGHAIEVARALQDALFSHATLDVARDPQRNTEGGYSNSGREDAWRLYLGIPQQHETFGVSGYRPSHSTDTAATYFKINHFADQIHLTDALAPETVQRLIRSIDSSGSKTFSAFDGLHFTDPGVMGHYQWTRGEDKNGHYLAYYDIWDLDAPGASHVGHPYEIYDRIYYNPKTYRIIAQPNEKDKPHDIYIDPQREVTVLPPLTEQLFQQWAKKNKITDVDDPDSHYDYRGFWLEHGDAPVRFGVDHFPDTFKQHGHPTFSVESQYSNGPRDGGRWIGEKFIPAGAP